MFNDKSLPIELLIDVPDHSPPKKRLDAECNAYVKVYRYGEYIGYAIKTYPYISTTDYDFYTWEEMMHLNKIKKQGTTFSYHPYNFKLKKVICILIH